MFYRRSGVLTWTGSASIVLSAASKPGDGTALRTFSFPAELGDTDTSVYPLDIRVVNQTSGDELIRPLNFFCP